MGCVRASTRHPSETRAAAVPLAVRRHPLVATVAHRLQARCGVPPGTRLVLGCSGGADSVALLLTLLALRDRGCHPAPLVVHVHHNLRASADDDAGLVARLCSRFQVPLELRHVHPARQDGSLAAVARILRYAALDDAANRCGAPYVAVAHHAEDQLETMLMALGRGAGLTGLSGMGWEASVPGAQPSDRRVVRPLLDVTRHDCQTLCRIAGVGWSEDPTNADPRQVRGRLRRDVLPVLEMLWPGAARRCTATAEILGAAAATLEKDLTATFGPPAQRRWERRLLAGLPVAVIAEGLRRAAVELQPSVADALGQRQLIEVAEAIDDGLRRPRSFTWPGGLRVMVRSREVGLEAGTEGQRD